MLTQYSWQVSAKICSQFIKIQTSYITLPHIFIFIQNIFPYYFPSVFIFAIVRNSSRLICLSPLFKWIFLEKCTFSQYFYRVTGRKNPSSCLWVLIFCKLIEKYQNKLWQVDIYCTQKWLYKFLVHLLFMST